MARLAVFCRKSAADRRMLALAAMFHGVAAVAVRALPFAGAQRLLACCVAIGPRPPADADVDGRAVRAVRSVAARLPGANCLTEALVVQCLLARHQRETTLCFGVVRTASSGRPFDAHAWLERHGTGLIGARTVAYAALAHPSRCVVSPSSR